MENRADLLASDPVPHPREIKGAGRNEAGTMSKGFSSPRKPFSTSGCFHHSNPGVHHPNPALKGELFSILFFSKLLSLEAQAGGQSPRVSFR